MVQAEDTPAMSQRCAVELIRLPDPTLGSPRLRQRGGFVWIDYLFPDGFRYVMMARVVGPVRDIEPLADGYRWTFEPLNNLRLTAYVAVVTTARPITPSLQPVPSWSRPWPMGTTPFGPSTQRGGNSLVPLLPRPVRRLH